MDDEQAKNNAVPEETPRDSEHQKTQPEVADSPVADTEGTPTQTQDNQPADVPAEQPQALAESRPDEPAPKKPKRRLSKRAKLIIALVVLFVVGAGGATAYLLLTKKSTTTNSTVSEPTPQNTDQKTTKIPATAKVTTAQLQDVYFSGSQQELAYIPLFSDEELKEYYQTEILTETKKEMKFYKVGTVKDGDLVLVKIPPIGPGGYEYALFVHLSAAFVKQHGLATTAIILQKHSSFYLQADDNVAYDDTSIIPVLKLDETITYGGITASKTPDTGPFFMESTDIKNMTEVSRVGQNIVYEHVIENESHPGVKQFSILLKQQTGLYVRYRYATDILKDDNSTTITLTDGSTTTKKYDWAMVRGGCGVVDSVNVLDKSYFNDLVQIGKAGSEPVYGLKSANHQVINAVYKAYNYDGTREGAVSKEQFWKDNGVVVVRNKLGYRVILVNADYQAQGECGKPVIYLYPEQKTDMSVHVGADVTISDPAYGTGWDVTAYPDGSIFNKKDGKTYPYLFWEGTGHGKYPQITEGFVVKRVDVERTMRSHLTQLGMNAQESADFLEFWLPHVPNKPYVRMTWFGTQQMNELAPLKLSVKPDTMIRIFLDFQGLDKPMNLKPQRLSHPERKGFVLVEWGGLLYVY